MKGLFQCPLYASGAFTIFFLPEPSYFKLISILKNQQESAHFLQNP